MPLRVRNIDEVRVLVEAYMEKAHLSATRFGWLANGDLSLVSKVRNPKYDPRLSTVDRILTYIEENSVETDVAEGL